MKSIITPLFLAFLLVISQTNFAQNSSSMWTKVEKSSLTGKNEIHRVNSPKKAEFYQLNLAQLKTVLQNAPVRFATNNPSNLIVSFPNAEGELEDFRVMESPIMAPELAAKFPMIKTYVAQGIDDPTAYMRFSVTQFGLHTMTLSGKRTPNYIDPYTQDRNYYMVYDKKSLGTDAQPFECLTPEDVSLPSLKDDRTITNKATNDQKIRTFRLAQTCTAEYGNIFAINVGTEKADIQAQMTITINRVNTVYEVDLGITLQFIANNDLLIFYGSTSSDPWNGEYNTATQNFLNSTLANSDYDIGHNFNTSGGGNAGCIGCVCVNGQKGSGMTGRSDPTGDAFDIDYVAHEMGHQFGGYHTMNTCSRSGSGQTEVEPASGSSVMGYAGICSSNVQMNSDAHFNYVNIRDISLNVKTGNSTCAAITTITNNPPTANAGADYTIPKSTAFVLEGSATDPDGMGSLTYEWSQNDPAQSPGNAAPLSTYAVGPMYRAKMPITSPNRYLPRIQDVIAGNLIPTWEVTPSVGRTLNFSFLVRDNDIQGGQTADDLMKVTVNGTAGPFVVTSHNTTGISLNSGANTTVTWNVAGTTAAPVSTANVNIFLSTDGGYTYPVTLANNVPNNGSANVVIPSGNATTQGRIMVRGAGNIFYAINSKNFAIVDAEFVMNFSNITSSNCPTVNAVYNFTYNTFLSFNETTVFSASGQPAGSIVTFNPTSASVDGTPVQVTVSGLNASMVGSYSIDITGTATSVTKLTTITLDVLNPSPIAANLTLPVNTATGIDPSTTFTWSNGGLGSMYNIDIATDASFTTIVDAATGLTANSYVSSALISSTTYYWRVTTYNNCGNAPTSSTFSFTTSSCSSLISINVPVVVAAASQTSNITVSGSGIISDVNLINLDLSHVWIGDVSAKLTSPQGTTIQLFDRPGKPASTYGCSGDDIFATFDDAATLTSTNFENTCGSTAPAISGTYQPINPLAVFNGENMNGVWVLTMLDGYTASDDGVLNGWSLQICSDATTVVTNYVISNEIKIYPNPTSNILTVDLGTLKNIETITLTDIQGKVLFQNRSITNNNIKIDLSPFDNGFYMLQVKGNDINNVFKVLKQ